MKRRKSDFLQEADIDTSSLSGPARSDRPERDTSAPLLDYSSFTGRSPSGQQSGKKAPHPSPTHDYSQLTGRHDEAGKPGLTVDVTFDRQDMRLPVKIRLWKNITALENCPAQEKECRGRFLVQLPEGTELTVCGDGFSERTVKVEYQGCFYFVFLQDINSPDGYDAA
jgi:hypothetical protein